VSRFLRPGQAARPRGERLLAQVPGPDPVPALTVQVHDPARNPWPSGSDMDAATLAAADAEVESGVNKHGWHDALGPAARVPAAAPLPVLTGTQPAGTVQHPGHRYPLSGTEPA